MHLPSCSVTSKLAPIDIAYGAYFGNSVAISGEYAIVGATFQILTKCSGSKIR
ncbi:MAG: FG-GAP repeat protein [Proteobacteria bacterium]|nr:FG-GAP repeat protein [Pseudomonadota bacterium]